MGSTPSDMAMLTGFQNFLAGVLIIIIKGGLLLLARRRWRRRRLTFTCRHNDLKSFPCILPKFDMHVTND